jgi:hypothetical protein
VRRRWLLVARDVGPYVACAIVLWRMASWEQAITQWVQEGQRVFDAAGADLAAKATELHDDAVTRDATQN